MGRNSTALVTLGLVIVQPHHGAHRAAVLHAREGVRLGTLELHDVAQRAVDAHLHEEAVRRVAVHVDPFEKQTLKPFFHVIGARVEITWGPGAFKLLGQGESTCTGSPPRCRRCSPPGWSCRCRRRRCWRYPRCSGTSCMCKQPLKPGIHLMIQEFT
jgi:hypothetical protein